MSGCIFCQLMAKKINLLFEDDKLFAMLSPEPVAPGHVVILPKEHAPIIEAVPDFIVGDMFKTANKIGIAVFEVLGAHGTNIIVQNGQPAGQKHNHTMLSVIPRFENDNLQIGWQPKPADEGELSKLEGIIKEETKNVGLFEREKPKPIEVEKPKEMTKEDYRTKQLRRIP
ncbi:MAG: HIT family protein [Candidatus Woesearchaeota archaeon]